jgi:predicted amidohydrolase
MQVIAVQLDIVWENKRANCEKVRKLLAATRVKPGSLIVLPELFDVGFTMNAAAATEGDARPTQTYLCALAKELDATIVAGVANDASPGRCYNEAVVIGPRGELARYRKMQPFCPGGEHFVYEAGDAAVAFDWHGVTVCPFVCYDLRFPEVIRQAATLGAELIAVIASWPAARTHHWVRLLQARAIENQCYVVGVNRCGTDPKFNYLGRSVLIDQHGEIMADAGDTEGVIAADLDFAALREYRAKLPFLADMKPRRVVAPAAVAAG